MPLETQGGPVGYAGSSFATGVSMTKLERSVPSENQVEYERHHRYAFASQRLNGLRVLDIGSGDGKGSAMLAAVALKVVGVDLNPALVQAAAEHYTATDRLEFLSTEDLTRLSFEAGSFDAIVSFGGFENCAQPEDLLAEIQRVLSPSGFIMISAPTLGEHDESSGREQRDGQLIELVGRHFRNHVVIGQRMVASSVMSPIDADRRGSNLAEYRAYTVDVSGSRPAASAAVVSMPDPEFLLCVASHANLPELDGSDSVFLMKTPDLWSEHARNALGAGVSDNGPPVEENDDAARVHNILALAEGRVQSLLESKALLEREVGRLSAAQKGDFDLSLVGPLMEDLAGKPVAADAPGLIRLLGQVAVRMATQDVRLAELASTQSKLAELQEALKSHAAERQGLLETLKATKLANGELEAQTAGLHSQIDETQRELIEVTRTRDHFQEEAGRIKLELSRALQSLTDARQSEHNNVIVLDEQVRSLQDAVAVANAQLAEHHLNQDIARSKLAEAEQLAEDFSRLYKETSRQVELLAEQETALKAALAREPSRIVEASTAPHTTPRPTIPQTTGEKTPSASRASAIGVRRLAGRAFASEIRARKADALIQSAAAQRQAIDAIDTLLHSRDRVRGGLAQASDAFDGLAIPTASVSATALPELQLPTTAPVRGWKSALRQLVRPQANKQKQRAQRRDARLSDDLLRAVFDPVHYIHVNSVQLTQGEDALDHYLNHGRAHGWSPHPLIDTGWIAAQRPTGAKFDLANYLTDPTLFSLSPHPLFDAPYYLAKNEDILRANANPLAHYLLHGWREGRAPNRLFDNAWYLLNNPEALAEGLNPLVHLARFGLSNHGPIHPLFDRAYYLGRYPDVAAGGMDAYVHYIAYGQAEGRIPSADIAQATRLQKFFTFGSSIDVLIAPHSDLRLNRDGDDLWPPAWDCAYWLPQKLRDLVISRYGEAWLGLYTHIFSVIERYAETPDDFDDSQDCVALTARARLLANVDLEGLAPTVSIIVPVYNNLLYTLTSILSVLEIEPSYTFEIIVGDDGSSDATARVIKSIGGVVKYHRNEKNLGFLRNCNAAARNATGEFIVFLNNDTVAMPGWLDQLIAPFEVDPTVGFTGSKLLNGDGTLQEAGGVFWEDGSAWNFGRNSDPMLPEFNYLKDVDYVSGAAIALPKNLWDRLGGFDPIYSPAYCEDADIAFRVRDLGLRTIYAPHSVIVHHEGRSHGRDVNSGVKAYQVINQKKFLERFQETLARENFPNAQEVFVARDRSRSRPHILIVDHYIPQWDQDAGSRSTFHFLRAFVNRGFQVTFWPDNLNEDRTYCEALQKMGVEVIYGPSYVGAFETWMAASAQYLNYALLCRPHISEIYIDAVIQAGVKSIYYGHDLHCMRARSAYQATGDVNFLLEADEWEERELAVSLKSNVVMYPGLAEIAYMSERLPSSVSLVRPPIIMYDDLEFDVADVAIDEAGQIDPYALMFVGGFSHTPNGDGITWFLDEIWPLLRAASPQFTLKVAGSKMPASLKRRKDPGVEFLGRVSDEELKAMYSTSGASIVPLRFGGGVKGKVIEAFAHGVPVVMTEIGAQGIPGAETFSFVAPADQTFATAIIAAANDRQEALARARKAVDFLRTDYSEDAFCNLLAAEVPELIRRRKPKA